MSEKRAQRAAREEYPQREWHTQGEQKDREEEAAGGAKNCVRAGARRGSRGACVGGRDHQRTGAAGMGGEVRGRRTGKSRVGRQREHSTQEQCQARSEGGKRGTKEDHDGEPVEQPRHRQNAGSSGRDKGCQKKREQVNAKRRRGTGGRARTKRCVTRKEKD